MPVKTRKIALFVLLGFFLVVLAVFVYFWWFVTSGRLKTLIEQQASRAANARVEMGALTFHWPGRVEVEGLTVAAVGWEETPFLTCRTARLRLTLRGLLSRQLLSLEVLSPRIELIQDENGNLNIPALATEVGEEGEPISIGSVKVSGGSLRLDLPQARGELKGLSVRYEPPLIPASYDKVLRLGFDSADFLVGRDVRTRIPLILKELDSRITLQTASSRVELEGDIEAFVTTTAPYLVLPPDVPVAISVAADYVASEDSIENGLFTFDIPTIAPIRVYGSISNLTGQTPTVDLDFSLRIPELAEIREYNELLQRPMFENLKVSGTLDVTGEVNGTLNDPAAAVKATTENIRLEWNDVTLEGVRFEIPMNLDAQGFTVGPGSVAARKGVIPAGQASVAFASMSGVLNADESRVALSDVRTKVEDLGELSMNGEYHLSSGTFRGSAMMEGLSVGSALKLVSTRFYEIPEEYVANGTANLECTLEGKLGSTLETMRAAYNFSLSGGELFLSEFVGAAGLSASSSGVVKTTAPDELWSFDVKGDVGGFEVLVDYFYQSFAGARFPYSLQGEYDLTKRRLRAGALTVNLGTMGSLTAKGSVRFASAPEIDAHLETDRIDLAEVYKQGANQVLSEVMPILKGAEIEGTASGKVAFRMQNSMWEAEGRLRLADGGISLADDAFSAQSVSVGLPFRLLSPREGIGTPSFEAEDFGSIRLGTLIAGPVDIPSLELRVALKDNALRVKGPTRVGLFDGWLDIGEIRGEELLGRSGKLTTALSVESMSLATATEKLGLPRVSGVVDGEFPEVTITLDSVAARGQAQARVFEGTITMFSPGIERPLSPVRTYRVDRIVFEDIHLLEVTDVLEFGSISGVLEGTVEGLEISQGQAAAFVADFETVKRKGVPQRINFEAVRNITILGTGQGFQASIGFGLTAFFDEFGYEKLGFHCSLKNDNFRMRGKVVKDGTEYFVRGVSFGPSINVINRNPGQTVSFKSMVERISRIQRAGEEDTGK
ncbi:MAG: hypothetical protein Kow0099_08480 [Candidatus Abyssubacteria bacterium]